MNAELCLCYISDFPVTEGPKDVNEGSAVGTNWEDEASVMTDLTCVCIVGIEDPVRDEVCSCCFPEISIVFS